MGFMTATFASFIYPIYFDDRHMADRVSLSLFWVYVLAIPFYLFFNVRVTGDHIPAMETIAYDLTPVIHNWFTRIDPFTNGMPSLHIGLPFAVWLTYLRWDEDGRWTKFRAALVLYIWVTGFAILYLGIHWVLDIIGGILVGILAVMLTDWTHGPVWRVADERLFTRRLARLLDDPKAWVSNSFGAISRMTAPVRVPSSQQTSAVIVAVLLGTGTVLLWDATHQDFPVEGVEWPTAAAGAGGWLVGVQELPDGSISIVAWNASTETAVTVESVDATFGEWDVSPEVEVSERGFVLYDSTRIDYVEFTDQAGVFRPMFSSLRQGITDVVLAEDGFGGDIVAVVYDDEIRYRNRLGSSVDLAAPPAPYSVVAASGSLFASAVSTDTGPAVDIISLATQLNLRMEIDARADSISDAHLEETYGMPVDYLNSTIVEMEMDSRWLVAVVDVGPVNRTILVDTVSGDQVMLSDPVWPSSSPSLALGQVAFLQIPRFDPTAEPEDRLTARDVFLHDIGENRTSQLTLDDDVDQSQPQVLRENVAWIEEDSDGLLEIRMYILEETFEPYSSVVLQTAIVMLIPLIVLWAFQASRDHARGESARDGPSRNLEAGLKSD
jgi:membrane-associated phospholipid phosphatase